MLSVQQLLLFAQRQASPWQAWLLLVSGGPAQLVLMKIPLLVALFAEISDHDVFLILVKIGAAASIGGCAEISVHQGPW